jgi:hypothetical protein
MSLKITGAGPRIKFNPAGGKRITITPLPYGVVWNKVTDTYRQGVISGQAFVEQPVPIFNVQQHMRRCLLSDAGAVNYYTHPTNSSLKSDGVTASVLDGTDGQVMVQCKKCHYLRCFDGDLRYYFVSLWSFSFRKSDSSVVNSSVHPFFIKGGVEVPYRYIGAYEAAYDGVSKLQSISGIIPAYAAGRQTFRTRAAARGAGWHQRDTMSQDFLGMMYLTEYADFDTQTKIGQGIANYAVWPRSPQALTGNSNAIGNASGGASWVVPKWAASTAKVSGNEVIPLVANFYTYRCTVAGTTAGAEPVWPTTIGLTVVDGGVTWQCVRSTQYMSYRGVENWYGHIWEWLDGVNVHNSTANGSRLYTSGNYTTYADDTNTGYTMTGQLPLTTSWIVDVLDADGFYPSSVSADSTKVCDYYTYYSTDPDIGWRAVIVGSNANEGTIAGAFSAASIIGYSLVATYIGGRLCF